MANIIDLVINSSAKGAVKSVKDAKNSTKETKTEIISFISVIKEMGSTLVKMTDAFDEYNTSLRLLKTTLGESAEEATTFIRRLSDMSGINETSLNKQVAKFSQMSESLGMSNQQAEKFSENLSIISTKLAMLYNTDYTKMANTVMKAVQGASVTLFSQTGIKLNDFARETTLAAYGIDRTADSLNKAELALVNYATILRQVTSDNNVYQNAVNSLAWQKQILINQVKRLAAAIGQLLTPAFTVLITAINGVIMALTEIIKLIGSLIGINIDVGASTKAASDGYKDLGASIGGAAKEAKKSLRGFDKLNNITTPSSGGGGAGGGLGIDKSLLGLLDSVGDGFLDIKNKATEIRDKILDWLGFLRNADGTLKGWSAGKLFKNIIDWWNKLSGSAKIFVGLGIAVAIAKIITGLKKLWTTFKSVKIVTWIDNIQKKFRDVVPVTKNGITTLENYAGAWDRVAIGVAGAVAAFAGITFIVDSMRSLKQDGPNVLNILGLIAGAILTIVGTIGVLEAATGFFAPWMVVVGAVVAGIAGIVAGLTTQNEAVVQSQGILTKYNDTLKEISENEKTRIDELDVKVGRIHTLTDELEGLVDSNGKVTGSEEEVGAKLSALNELMGTEYEITNGQITLNGKKVGSYDDLKASIDRYCDSLRTEGLLEIKREQYNKRLEKQQDLEKAIDVEVKNLIKSQEKYDTKTQEGYNQWLNANMGRIQHLQDLQGEYKTNEQYLDAYERAGYLASVGRFDEAQELLSKTFSNVGATTEETIGLIEKKAGELPRTVDTIIDDITRRQATFTLKVNADTSAASRQLDTLMRNKSITLGTNIGARAEGGFVNQGELFIAREAGPELVGSINNHTAVANNDQIIKGIQGGVFSGMMSALSSANFGGGNVTIEATGDTDGLLNFITFKQKQKDRQFN